MENSAELQYHLQIREGDVGRYVLLPGDPGRAETIAGYFDNPVHVAQNREYNTYTGTLFGEKVSVVSTGIGCPSTAIAVEELIKVGADTFIRVGTSGALQPEIKTGDIAVVTGAIRDEGTTLHYMPVEFPAIADIDVVLALKDGAEKSGFPYHLGISQSKDSFYGEIEPMRMPVSERLTNRWKAWMQGGAICSEMEAAAIFIIAAIHRKRAGGVMLMAGNDLTEIKTEEEYRQRQALFDVNRVIKTAIAGLQILIQRDAAKR